ncbi:hypothetical protein SteCoe_16017 [Stentor coeruleus]|uniref:EGF-like domain-containing protein n=1 Tax=Stentor coeruleus TaxID=5963 RepID=A0A1R2C252_9CILI|nr:hypothetical protein SteCoe_16017 [Stentor coeruleus]
MFIFLVFYTASAVLSFTTTPTTPTTVAVPPATISLVWAISTVATTDCSLVTYGGLFSFSSFTGLTTHESYSTNTYYQAMRFTSSSSPTITATYIAKNYYINTTDTFTVSSTDYVTMVCNDGTTTIVSDTIIGLGTGWIPYCTATSCTSRGNCNDYDGSCKCYYPYFGTSCEKIDCGYCHNGASCDTSTGTCTCGSVAAYGTHCEYLYCPRGSSSTNCNHGYCEIQTGICHCYEGYEGYSCDKKKCLNDCNEGGVCDTSGVCTCYDNYFGKDCAYKRCPRDCGAYGGCNFSTGECNCYGTDGDNDCMFTTCPSTGTGLCNLKGVCNYYSGLCECYSGYSGLDCSYVEA